MHEANTTDKGKKWNAAAGKHRRHSEFSARAQYYSGLEAYVRGNLPKWGLLALYFKCVRNICAHQGAARDIVRVSELCELGPHQELANRLMDALQLQLEDRTEDDSTASNSPSLAAPGTTGATAASMRSSYGPHPVWTALARLRLPGDRLRSHALPPVVRRRGLLPLRAVHQGCVAPAWRPAILPYAASMSAQAVHWHWPRLA